MNENPSQPEKSKRMTAVRRWAARVGMAYLIFCAVKGIFWLAAGAAAYALWK